MKYIYLFFLCLIVTQSNLYAETASISHTTKSATSHNSKFVINYDKELNSVIILDSINLIQLKTIPLINNKGEFSGVSGIHDASNRNSFIIALENSPEIWEINYQNPAPVGFGTWVHDYRKDSGEAVNTLFPVRRLLLKANIDDFFLDEKDINIVSVSCNGNVQIIDLDLGRRVSQFNTLKGLSENKNPYKIKSLNHQFFSKISKKATFFRGERCNEAIKSHQ